MFLKCLNLSITLDLLLFSKLNQKFCIIQENIIEYIFYQPRKKDNFNNTSTSIIDYVKV